METLPDNQRPGRWCMREASTSSCSGEISHDLRRQSKYTADVQGKIGLIRGCCPQQICQIPQKPQEHATPSPPPATQPGGNSFVGLYSTRIEFTPRITSKASRLPGIAEEILQGNACQTSPARSDLGYRSSLARWI